MGSEQWGALWGAPKVAPLKQGRIPSPHPLVGSHCPQSTSWRISSLERDMGAVIICGVINMEMIFGLIRMQQRCELRKDVFTLLSERSDRYLNARD